MFFNFSVHTGVTFRRGRSDLQRSCHLPADFIGRGLSVGSRSTPQAGMTYFSFLCKYERDLSAGGQWAAGIFPRIA
mgnify:CR=1 FL=1